MLDDSLRRCPFCGQEVILAEAVGHFEIQHLDPSADESKFCPIASVNIVGSDKYKLINTWSYRSNV